MSPDSAESAEPVSSVAVKRSISVPVCKPLMVTVSVLSSKSMPACVTA